MHHFRHYRTEKVMLKMDRLAQKSAPDATDACGEVFSYDGSMK